MAKNKNLKAVALPPPQLRSIEQVDKEYVNLGVKLGDRICLVNMYNDEIPSLINRMKELQAEGSAIKEASKIQATGLNT